jgi:beta-phosphoglucomutase
MIKAIFFDFNGIIIDDEPLQMKAYGDALAPHGITLTEENYYSLLGTDDTGFIRRTFERAAVPLADETLRAVIERKSALHRELIKDELPLFPGVLTFIKAAAREFPLGLVSMASRVEIDYALERAGFSKLFGVIVSAQDAPRYKPDPCCYERAFALRNEQRRAARQLPLLAQECLAIEDAPPGIQAARAAGMRTLGVTNTVPERALREAGADVVTRSLADWTTDAIHHVF